MFIWDQMVGQRALASLSLTIRRTLAMVSPNSTATNGRAATSRSAKIATPVLKAVALEAVEALVVAAEASVAVDLAEAAVDSAVGEDLVVAVEATAVVDLGVAVSEADQLPVASTQVLLLPTRRPTPLQTMLPPEESVVPSSSFAT
jgi:hypothetical protein